MGPHSALTRSELKGFTLVLRAELLARDQTLVLCLNAALTFRAERGSSEAISEIDRETDIILRASGNLHCKGSRERRQGKIRVRKRQTPIASSSQAELCVSDSFGSLRPHHGPRPCVWSGWVWLGLCWLPHHSEQGDRTLRNGVGVGGVTGSGDT